MDSQNILSPGPVLQAESFDLGLSDQELLDLSAREVTQMCANFSPEQIKAIKHKRRTLKNREYAGKLRVESFFLNLETIICGKRSLLAICRSRRTTQREELIMKCKEYEIKIKDIKKQNTSLENAKRKITDILRQINYVPFTHSANDDETNPEPGMGLLYLWRLSRSVTFLVFE